MVVNGGLDGGSFAGGGVDFGGLDGQNVSIFSDGSHFELH